MITRDAATGELKVELSHDEFMDLYHRWQRKPETVAMFAEIAAERKARVSKILAEIGARKK